MTALEEMVRHYMMRHVVMPGIGPSDLPLSAERKARLVAGLEAVRAERGGTLVELADAVSEDIAERRREIASENVQNYPETRASLERAMTASIQVWLEIRRKIPFDAGRTRRVASIDGRVRL